MVRIADRKCQERACLSRLSSRFSAYSPNEGLPMYWHVSATNPVSARLIGAIFLERGLVTEEQLQAALALQVETKEHLGEILVQHFGVSRIELASVLAEQWADLERANAAATPADPDKPTLQIVPTFAEVSGEPAEESEAGEGGPRRPLGE